MPNLSDIFHDLAERDQRDFASAPRDTSAISHARRARGRTRVLQATGGALALGGLAVGGTQLLPDTGGSLQAAAVDNDDSEGTGLTVEPETLAPSVNSGSATVDFSLTGWSQSELRSLQLLTETFQCDAPAPTPTAGAATLSLGDIEIRSEEFVQDLTPWINGDRTDPVPLVDDNGNTQYDAIAELSVTSTSGDDLYADIPTTQIVLVKDGVIKAALDSLLVDPTEPSRTIVAPAGTPADEAHDVYAGDGGVTPVLSDQAVDITTGYKAWGCDSDLGEVFVGDPGITTFPAMSDYLEPGDYQAYAIARVTVDDQSAAQHYLNSTDVDLWNDWTLEQELTDLVSAAAITHGDGFLESVELPVPQELRTDQATDEIIVSAPVTVTIP